MRWAARVAQSGMQVVVSAMFRVDVQPDAVVIHWDSVRAGVLPVPRALLEEAARKLAGHMALPEHAVSGGQITLPNEWLWPNGQRPFRITNLSISEGELRVRLEPS
jgi:hypothetical protein